MLEQGPDFCRWFDTTQFSYHRVHPIHAKMFSIQMLLHFSQIVLRVCTLVLFIYVGLIVPMYLHLRERFPIATLPERQLAEVEGSVRELEH